MYLQNKRIIKTSLSGLSPKAREFIPGFLHFNVTEPKQAKVPLADSINETKEVEQRRRPRQNKAPGTDEERVKLNKRFARAKHPRWVWRPAIEAHPTPNPNDPHPNCQIKK